MFGWEYPPHISGGLGTACQGLTTALAPLGVHVDFVVPHLYGSERAPHMTLHDAREALVAQHTVAAPDAEGRRMLRVTSRKSGKVLVSTVAAPGASPGPPVQVLPVPSPLSPYLTAEEYEQMLESLQNNGAALTLPQEVLERLAVEQGFEIEEIREIVEALSDQSAGAAAGGGSGAHYGRDLMGEVQRYAAMASRLAKPTHDVIHAHDWMTYPAGVEAKRRTGKPLVVHVHSLEFDRSGEGGNQQIIATERLGLENADLVIAVSHYTRGLIHRIHGTPLDRIAVVHNGVYKHVTVEAYKKAALVEGPVVLFLGRVTFQKGPDYFVQAAAKVVEHVPKVRFIMAGSGDMLPHMKRRVQELGVEEHFQFPGFLKGKQVEEAFSIADVYVMPSVSEPFGISALEAMAYNKPVIISRQSGVAEVLRHALKVDFWDTELLASKIVSMISYPELRESIVGMAREEVKRLHWDAAAQKTVEAYRAAIEQTPVCD